MVGIGSDFQPMSRSAMKQVTPASGTTAKTIAKSASLPPVMNVFSPLWSRTAETRRVLLSAAREVFVERGFADASVSEVVERAGSSVGSRYHHFGAKPELFMSLWQDHQAAHEQRAANAVGKARAAGEEDPLTLFIA